MKSLCSKEYHNLSSQERRNFIGTVKWGIGSIAYHKNGFYHREESVECTCSSDEGCLYPTEHGTCCGPAYIGFNDYKEWRFEGRLHNLNGPARIYSDGREEYFIHGEPTTKEAVELYVDLMKLKEIGK
jgi:hypothetical protein